MGSAPEINTPIIVFDGVCNFCNASVNFIIRNESGDRLKFTPSQSKMGEFLLNRYDVLMDASNTLLFIENGQVYKKSRAALKIAAYLKKPINWMTIFSYIPKPLSDFCYDLIAKNRYRLFGRTEECMVPSADLRKRFLDSPVVG